MISDMHIGLKSEATLLILYVRVRTCKREKIRARAPRLLLYDVITTRTYARALRVLRINFVRAFYVVE